MLDPVIDPTMKGTLLPAPLIIKGFVHGEDICNYELYLLELINISKWFSQRYPGGFQKPASESNGECDAINESYQLDFKPLASKTALQAGSIFSSQIYTENGVTSFCTSKVDSNIQTTRIFAAFRSLSLDDLIRLRNSTIKKYGIGNDVCAALKIFEVQKNVLLFFPYKFTFEKPHQYDVAVKSITEALNHDFRTAFLFRNQYASGYDTFLTCIYGEAFLVYCVCDGELQLCDSVATHDIKTFTRLLERYGDWWD